jgi:peptidoglycan/xylan/chitin deacetylase (PgdA/CDA1 family)/2-polyprenyl-3-methyl-5-hydroxy-6-metoxy-1,4-benzoquinol methylase
MICPLSPAHFFALAAFQLYALLWFIQPSLSAIPLAIFVLICVLAPVFPGCSYYLPVISRGSRKEKAVALTFDDGPDPAVTPRLLELLDRHGAKATFFVTGLNTRQYPDLIRAILAKGHSLGNHSYHHSPFLMLKGRRTIHREVESAHELLKTFGVVPLAFRPPVGITNPHLWPILLKLGMFCVNFSCRAGDMGNRRIRHLAQRVLGKVRPGDIVLLHDVAPPKGDVEGLLAEFEAILEGLKAKGLEVRPLARIIGREIMETPEASSGGNAAALFYNGLAASYDQEQFCSNVSISRRTELALFTARIPELFEGAGRVLEIGAGTGIFTTTIARHARQVDALDISANMLALLQEKCRAEGISNIRTQVGNVETMELEGPYDVVCAFSALEYLTDLPALIQRLAPHMNPGGTIYFITARKSFFRRFTQIGNAMRQGMWLKAHSRREFTKMLEAAGFTPVSITSHLLKCVINRGMLLEVIARKPLAPGETP